MCRVSSTSPALGSPSVRIDYATYVARLSLSSAMDLGAHRNLNLTRRLLAATVSVAVAACSHAPALASDSCHVSDRVDAATVRHPYPSRRTARGRDVDRAVSSGGRDRGSARPVAPRRALRRWPPVVRRALVAPAAWVYPM